MAVASDITVVTSDETLTDLFNVYLVDATSNAINITLPIIVTNGQHFKFNRCDTTTNIVTLIGNGGQLINGNATILLPIGGSLELHSYNNVWHTVNAGGDTTPVGIITAFGGTAAPTGYLMCDGAEISRTTYVTLFDIIGTSYGSGNGTTTFNVPDLRQRFPLGQAVSGTGSVLGSTGGTIDHDHGSPLTTSSPSNATPTNLIIGGLVASDGHTHSVTVPSANPPFQTVNYIIKAN